MDKKFAICFSNPAHIGDVWLSVPFVRKICEENPDIIFYFFSIIGHAFFDNISNLKNLQDNVSENYDISLNNLQAPESHINIPNEFKMHFLIPGIGGLNEVSILNYNKMNIITLNTWCGSKSNYVNALGPGEIDVNINFYSQKIKNMINVANTILKSKNSKINIKYSHSLRKYDYLPKIDTNVDISIFNNWLKKNKEKQKIFIYNFMGRCNFVKKDFNNDILKLSKKKDIIIIVPSYCEVLKNIENIKFCDKDFKCNYKPSCYNLLQIARIAEQCESIVTLPTGAAWGFYNCNMDIKDKKYYMFLNQHYTDKLNNWYNFNSQSNDNPIKNIFSLDEI